MLHKIILLQKLVLKLSKTKSSFITFNKNLLNAGLNWILDLKVSCQASPILIVVDKAEIMI